MVLRDLLASGVLPSALLDVVFRQAGESRIITTAHAVNAGRIPEFTPETGGDFFFIERESTDDALGVILELVRDRIPAKFGFDPARDIQVLAPMNRGVLGVRNLNARLQDAINPRREGGGAVSRFGTEFRAGDKVIQTRNNYDKDVFNGDIGTIRAISQDDRELVVDFDARRVTYDFNELDELNPAFAITVHKSQGSEFPCVILPVAMEQYLLLQRNLLYTAITRGKRLVIVVGQKKAFATAVRNHTVRKRCSGLLARLRAGA